MAHIMGGVGHGQTGRDRARTTRPRPSPSPAPFSRPADTPSVAVIRPQFRGTPAAIAAAPRVFVSSAAPRPGGVDSPLSRRNALQQRAATRGRVLQRVLRQVPAYVPPEYRQTIARSSIKEGLDPAVFAAQLRQESGFDPNALNPQSGAGGIAQFLSSTGQSYGLTPEERFEPKKAIRAASRFMGDLTRQFGSQRLALAAYNAGPGAVQQYGGVPPFEETQNYVSSILSASGGGGQAAPSVRPPPSRAVSRFIDAGGERFRGLDPLLQRRLVQLGRRAGEPVSVTSARRTTGEQAQLYRDYLAGRGNLAAPPGSSRHESGLAADLALTSRQRGLLPRLGLSAPVGGEPWHIELTGRGASRLTGGPGAIPPARGTGTIGAGPVGTSATRELSARGRGRRVSTSLLTVPFAARAPFPGEDDLEEEDPFATLLQPRRRVRTRSFG